MLQLQYNQLPNDYFYMGICINAGDKKLHVYTVEPSIDLAKAKLGKKFAQWAGRYLSLFAKHRIETFHHAPHPGSYDKIIAAQKLYKESILIESLNYEESREAILKREQLIKSLLPIKKNYWNVLIEELLTFLYQNPHLN